MTCLAESAAPGTSLMRDLGNGDSAPLPLTLRTPRWRQPRFNGFALVLLVASGVLLALTL